MAKSVTKLNPQFAGGDTPVSLIGFARGGYINPQMLYRMATIRKEISSGRQPSHSGKYAQRVRQMLSKKQGNMIPGSPPLNPYQDNKLVPMQSGEYVIPREAVNKLGVDNLDNMVQNALGTISPPSGSPVTGFAKGGYWGNPSGTSQTEPGRWFGALPARVKFGGGPPMAGMNNDPIVGRWNPWGNPSGIGPRSPWQGNGPVGTHSQQDAVDEQPNFWRHQNAGNVFMSPRDWQAGQSDLGHTMYNPFNMFSTMQPGMPWSPTMIPTTYDSQGYPMAVPPYYATNSSDPTGLLHAGQQLHNR